MLRTVKVGPEDAIERHIEFHEVEAFEHAGEDVGKLEAKWRDHTCRPEAS